MRLKGALVNKRAGGCYALLVGKCFELLIINE